MKYLVEETESAIKDCLGYRVGTEDGDGVVAYCFTKEDADLIVKAMEQFKPPCGHADHAYDPEYERYLCCGSRICRCRCAERGGS